MKADITDHANQNEMVNHSGCHKQFETFSRATLQTPLVGNNKALEEEPLVENDPLRIPKSGRSSGGPPAGGIQLFHIISNSI